MRLAKLRGCEQGLPAGQRDTFVFLAGCFLAKARLARDFKAEVFELAREFAPTWSNTEIRSCLSSVLSRVEAAERGQKVAFKGREVDARYRFSNETLVEWLDISSGEAVELKTILPKDETRRRNTERHAQARREAGAMPREGYQARAADRRQRAIELAASGMPRKAIAAELGVTTAAVNGYLRA